MAQYVLNDAACGQTVAVAVGDELKLHLEENPTTGYRWSADPPADGSLTVQHSEFVSGIAVAPGGGGMRVFTLRAQKAGTAAVRFYLQRDWEGPGAAIKRCEIIVQVRV